MPTFRFPLHDDDPPRPLGPEAGLKEYAQLRKSQGFNCIGMLAALPNWAQDGHPNRLTAADGTVIRQACPTPGTETAMDMHNEGGRAFAFPGKVPGYEDVFPDLDRLNLEYFKVLDQKIDCLNEQGFVPFLEVARRDTGQAWKKYYDWPDSYTRYVQYVFARYQANITIFSPIHYDYYGGTISGREYTEPCNAVIDRFGPPPFGALLSANCNPSTLVNFGGPDACHWLDVHQIGNSREHHTYWWLTEIYHTSPPKPAFNGEPYYAGLFAIGEGYPLQTEPNGEEDELYVRSGMYGSFLSAALPATSTAAKASGTQILSQGRGSLCGTHSSPARRPKFSISKPCNGRWGEPCGSLSVGPDSFISLLPLPDDQDWGLMLELLPE